MEPMVLVVVMLLKLCPVRSHAISCSGSAKRVHIFLFFVCFSRPSCVSSSRRSNRPISSIDPTRERSTSYHDDLQKRPLRSLSFSMVCLISARPLCAIKAPFSPGHIHGDLPVSASYPNISHESG